jgi:hypothetical protein
MAHKSGDVLGPVAQRRDRERENMQSVKQVTPELARRCCYCAARSDDTLWVATVKGLARLDGRRFQRTNHKPAIYMEEVDVGRTKASPGRELVLPPGTHHVEFHFTAVDLVSPEKIRLQYRLNGVDPLWLDADSTRTAIYNFIPVGAHSFHVRACNRDGVWDRVGIVYSVIQKPFLYETTCFD